MFTEEIKESLKRILPGVEIVLEHPADLVHGDYSTNVALVASNSKELAEEIVKKWQKTDLPDFIEKVEVAGPGFLNIWLKFDALGKQLAEVLKQNDRYGSSDVLQGKKILLEHTSPNTNKSFHVGHVRNNITGMAIARILEFNGAKVTKDCLFNDRGIHICKAMWGYLKESSKLDGWKENLDYWFEHQNEWPQPEEQKPDKFVENFYVKGIRAEEEEKNKAEMQAMLLAWEEGEPKVRALWQKMNNWVYQGFEKTFFRLASSYDHAWYESEFYLQAKEMISEGLKKGIFKKLPDGAVLTDLKEFNLPDTIVERADGTSMYFTQDIYLTSQKVKKFPADKYIWMVGPEQQLHLKQVFAVCDQLGLGKRDWFTHLWYGYVFLKGQGKMSSRTGTVISADELMDEAKKRAGELIKEENLTPKQKEDISEKVGLGAIKYSLLKLGRTQDVFFDWGESISLQGNSGPYLQYTYARTCSVLAKAGWSLRAKRSNLLKSNLGEKGDCFGDKPLAMTEEETFLLRIIYKFPEAVEEAGRQYSPNIVCGFLFDLAQKFNLFYDKQRIIGSENEEFRLLLTAAVGQILKNGLNLLGIKELERM